MKDRLTGNHIHFVNLQTALFCVECEIISENNTSRCFSCGSQAVLSLSRVLGGSLRGTQVAHVIEDLELDRLVRDLLRTVPAHVESRVPPSFATLAPSRHHARSVTGQSRFSRSDSGPLIDAQ